MQRGKRIGCGDWILDGSRDGVRVAGRPAVEKMLYRSTNKNKRLKQDCKRF